MIVVEIIREIEPYYVQNIVDLGRTLED